MKSDGRVVALNMQENIQGVYSTALCTEELLDRKVVAV
jgi:hypothetical protein